MPFAFSHVSFSYSGKADESGAWALHDIDFSLEDGEVLGIAGRMGSGKSTLVRLANGLEAPTRGCVTVDGIEVSRAHGAAQRRARMGVAVVLQYPERQLFANTVREDVAFGPKNAGIAPAAIVERVDEALAAVGLDAREIGSASPFALSGGQQRRVAIAGALALHPRVLVMDEPTAGLDARGRECILDLTERLSAQGTIVAIASHSMDDLARVAHRILVLADGRQMMLEPPSTAFERIDVMRSIGLDVPAPYAMAARLRARGFDLPRTGYDERTLAEDIASDLTATL